MKILDTNIVLSYLLSDDIQLSPRAAELIEQHEVFVRNEVACEAVYVLQKVYHLNRAEIRSKLTGLLHASLIAVEHSAVFEKALELYAARTLDIVDAFLCAYHAVEDVEVVTFDEKLQRCLKKENAGDSQDLKVLPI
jgi:predicted nucleic-acid-binding protein